MRANAETPQHAPAPSERDRMAKALSEAVRKAESEGDGHGRFRTNGSKAPSAAQKARSAAAAVRGSAIVTRALSGSSHQVPSSYLVATR